MNRRILISVISITASLALMATGAFAAFTSAAGNTGNTFGAGSMTLLINPTGNVSSTTPLFTIANAAPGVSYTEPLVLKNSGTVDAAHTYLASITETGSTPNLGDKLDLEILNSSNTVIAGPAPITSVAWSNIDLGALIAGSSNSYTASITFDSSADSTYEGATASFALNFLASQ